jgi:DNA-directed RNA polymerase beta subunit
MTSVIQKNFRIRNTYGQHGQNAKLPNLISLQKGSYEEFLDKKLPELLKKFLTFTDTQNPTDQKHAKDSSTKIELLYESHKLDTPKYDIAESVQRGITYAAPLKVKLNINKIQKEQKPDENGNVQTSFHKLNEVCNDVYLGDIPLQTEKGTFIINGTERVIVSQILRSPGVFFYEEQSATSQRMTYKARVVPYLGDWLDFEFDSKNLLYVRINKGRKLFATTLLRGMGYTKKQILQMFYHACRIDFVNEIKLQEGETSVYQDVEIDCVEELVNQKKIDKDQIVKKYAQYENLLLAEAFTTKTTYEKYSLVTKDLLQDFASKSNVMKVLNYGKVKGKILAQNVVDPTNANFVVLHKGILVKDADVKRLQEYKVEKVSVYLVDRAFKQVIRPDYLKNQKLYFSLTHRNGTYINDTKKVTVNLDASFNRKSSSISWFEGKSSTSIHQDRFNVKVDKNNKDSFVTLQKNYKISDQLELEAGRKLSIAELEKLEKHFLSEFDKSGKLELEFKGLFVGDLYCKAKYDLNLNWTIDKSQRPLDSKEIAQMDYDLVENQIVAGQLLSMGKKITAEYVEAAVRKELENKAAQNDQSSLKLHFKATKVIHRKLLDGDQRKDITTTIDDDFIKVIQTNKIDALPIRFENIKDNILIEDVILDGKIIKYAGEIVTDADIEVFKANGLSIQVCFIDEEYFSASLYRTLDADLNKDDLNKEMPAFTQTVRFDQPTFFEESNEKDSKDRTCMLKAWDSQKQKLVLNGLVLAKDIIVDKQIVKRAGESIGASYQKTFYLTEYTPNQLKTELVDKPTRIATSVYVNDDEIVRAFEIISEKTLQILQENHITQIELLVKHPEIEFLEAKKAEIEVYHSKYDLKVEDVKEVRVFLRNHFLQVFKHDAQYIDQAEGLILAKNVYAKKDKEKLLAEALTEITPELIALFKKEQVEFETYCTSITRLVRGEELDKIRGYSLASDVYHHDGRLLKSANSTLSADNKISLADVELFKKLNLTVEVYLPNVDLDAPNVAVLFGSDENQSKENRAFFKDQLNFFFGNHRNVTDLELLQISIALQHLNRVLRPSDNVVKQSVVLFNNLFKRFYTPIGGLVPLSSRMGEYSNSTTLPRYNGSYELKPYGRIKLNHKFRLNVPENYSWLTKNDVVESVRYILALNDNNTETYRKELNYDFIADEGDRIKALQKAEAIRYQMHLAGKANVYEKDAQWKSSILDIKIDDIDHLGNRRVSLVGELIENQYQVGLVRMQRTFKEKGNKANNQQQDKDKDKDKEETKQLNVHDLLNAKSVQNALKEYFASSQLSQFMDQTNPLSEVTHKRRLSALGPGGLHRDRAGFEVRDVHMSHYGRICPIETPEGANIGLIASLSTFAKINYHGFIETPYRRVKVENNRAQVVFDEEPRYYNALEEEFSHYINEKNKNQSKTQNVAQAKVKKDENGYILEENVYVRSGEDFKNVSPKEVHLVDVSPNQMVSVAASLIPFLENDDANRALMGSNMQRQAVPLLVAEAPLVGTGIEINVGKDSGITILAKSDGIVESVDSERIVVTSFESELPEVYHLVKFKRSNQNTCINQKPLIEKGDIVKKGDVLADGPSTEKGELALGRNVIVAFMPWCGYNFEDSILISEKLVQDDVYTSIHIEEFDCVARDTKGSGSSANKEEITKDIPGVDKKQLDQLEKSGIVRIGAEVKTNDILVGKITPKIEHQPTPEEKLLKAIFGEKAQDVKNTSLVMPHGMSGTVIGSKVFSRNVQVTAQSKVLVIKGGKNSSSHEVDIESIDFADGNFKIIDKKIYDPQNVVVSEIDHEIPEKHSLKIEFEVTELEEEERDKLDLMIDGLPFSIEISSQKGSFKLITPNALPSAFKVVLEDNLKNNNVDQENQDIQHQHDLEANEIKNTTEVIKNILKKAVKHNLKKKLEGKEAKYSLLDANGVELLKKKQKISKEALDRINELDDLKNIDVTDDLTQKECKALLDKLEEQISELELAQNIKIKKISDADDLPAGVLKMVKVYVAIKRKLQVGDKMAGRHGNKGVVSRVLPIEDMPFLADGTPVEMVLNPLGVPSRMNIGQILETHLGWAARNLGQKINRMLDEGKEDAILRDELKACYQNSHDPAFFDGLSSENLHKFIRSVSRGVHVATPVFDSASEDEIKRYLKLAGLREDARSILFDGRTGEKFDNPVTVGIMYVLKLHHLVDDKIHARSIGPYSLVTQQPLGGKAQFGGQRLGEMEVWAMEAYGAAYTLQEFLTVKSDDRDGRTHMYQNIVKGDNRPLSDTCKLPESFKVLLKELQSLALDIELISDHEE